MAASLSEDLADVSAQFRRGWDRSLNLAEALERNGQRDAAQGFTQVGPHRADLRVMVGDALAADILSRGQMKFAGGAEAGSGPINRGKRPDSAALFSG